MEDQAFWIKSMLESGGRYRSNILVPLNWLIGITITGLIGTLHFEAPIWLTIGMFFMLLVEFIVYMGVYLYSYTHDKDDLRSDWLVAHKKAIEKVYGDNTVGKIIATDIATGDKKVMLGQQGSKENG